MLYQPKYFKIWTLVWETGDETTNNRSHLQLIIYFWAGVWLVSDYANMSIFYIKASNQDRFFQVFLVAVIQRGQN